MEMVKLQPHLYERICSQADYVELLYHNHAGACQRLDEMAAEDRTWLEYLFKKYHVADLDALKAYLKVVYEPSWRDRSSIG